MVGSSELRGDMTLLTEIYQVRAGELIQKLQKTGKITDYCKKLKVMTSVTNNAHETGLFSVYNPAKPSLFKDTFSMMLQKI
jgi:hypothetical protein